MKTLSGAKKGDLFYIKFPDLDIFEVLNVKEGYEDEYGYKDVNANSIYIKSIINGEESVIDSRSVFSSKFSILDNDTKRILVQYVFAYLNT